ncbi:hypothetical protein MPRF_42370 [Mycolicibacterium parafortuitum]|uniref:Uncharacterized protein n=1 Tax=Mycolicibacterium parafortuitum TaxID=39692 RepID=A0A7I7U7M0_MYCPF|nr:hypothetical protein MPRF_42370 [Mycolicibacterium parafortuitum]
MMLSPNDAIVEDVVGAGGQAVTQRGEVGTQQSFETQAYDHIRERSLRRGKFSRGNLRC